MKITTIIILALILILLAVSILEFSFYKPHKEVNNKPFVSRVIDGDTFELSTGETIRLICINTPESYEKKFTESKQFLEQLILNKEVRLESDKDNKDRYGRLLRYVYINDTFVNKEMVQQKYANVYRYGNDTTKCDEIGSKT